MIKATDFEMIKFQSKYRQHVPTTNDFRPDDVCNVHRERTLVNSEYPHRTVNSHVIGRDKPEDKNKICPSK